jgi:hypothetical protein
LKRPQRSLDRAGLVPELDAQHPVGLRDTPDLVEEIHMPGAAAKLAIGYPLEANLLLNPDHIPDHIVLDAAQFFGREATGLMLGPRPQQFRRAQQAADVVGAERRSHRLPFRMGCRRRGR